jgi:hypothetical protein
MPNDEMMRPCLHEGWELKEPFDACDFNMDYFEVFRNESDCNYNVYFLGTKIATVDEYADSFPIYRQIITTIGNALKAPVKVTQAVLEAMEKVPEAKFWVGDDETKYKLERPCNTYVSLNDEWNNGRDFDDGGIPYTSKLQIGDYIQADCPLALQVLLGFIIEGVPVND